MESSMKHQQPMDVDYEPTPDAEKGKMVEEEPFVPQGSPPRVLNPTDCDLDSSTMVSSMKRQQPMDEDDGPPPPRDAKKGKMVAEEPFIPSRLPTIPRVLLNPADCNMDFNVEGDGLLGSALYEKGFAYCWSGARANVGINGGKYCFGCQIIAPQPVDMINTPLNQQYLCRIGISRGDDAVGNLGETLHSFGFCGTEEFSDFRIFPGYEEKFGIGDTIVCYVDLESKPLASIGFSKNGRWLGIAKQFDAGPCGLEVVNCPMKKLKWESALFPHILLKNVIAQMQFSIEDGLILQQGYKPWASAIGDGKAILGPDFENPNDCELIMMIGLPVTGKSTWAENLVKTHPEKRYVILGADVAMDRMKVLRNHNHGEVFDRMMTRATGIFNTLMLRASMMPRNFIIDQPNLYKNARKLKLKLFYNHSKIGIVVFPNVKELQNRIGKRFKEIEVPVVAINDMLANYTLPMSKHMPSADEYFDEVFFPELNREESQRCLNEMKANLNWYKEVFPRSGKGIVETCDSSSIIDFRERSIPPFGAPPQNQGISTFPNNDQVFYDSQTQGPPQHFVAPSSTAESTTIAPYGSPYGTPIPMPSDGNHPQDDEHRQGHGHPRPRLY
ncbi:hypothetical protein ACH5RR_015005 [Cinchona calisaya]|uniref:SPRY domain-containing protein n=1 Tax=Cinchona calisaya TaxID=153742 RepID=A0ABD2ZRY0_9GENT